MAAFAAQVWTAEAMRSATPPEQIIGAVRGLLPKVLPTTGHCVKYQGSWHTDWIFVPGYDNGNAPDGQWAAKKTLTTPQWEASEDENFDVGIGVVNR